MTNLQTEKRKKTTTQKHTKITTKQKNNNKTLASLQFYDPFQKALYLQSPRAHSKDVIEKN